MKRLVLMRHAKSSWDDTTLDDHDRPLALRGLRDAPVMGRRLAARGIRPDLLLTSTAERAQQTGLLLQPAFAKSSFDTVTDRRIYMASPGELLGALAAVDDRYDQIILVGHNPGMTLLANAMVPELGLGNLPTAGTVAVDCDTPSWSGIDAAGFSLVFYDFPKNTQPAA